MSHVVEYRLPCPKCPSSDAFHRYSDGHGYCFSCHYTEFIEESMEEDKDFTYEYLPFRGITKETMQFFDCKTKIDKDGKPVAIGYPYPTGAIKIRKLDVPKNEAFSILGPDKTTRAAGTLFGRDRFSAGSSKSITITEGQEDALSAYQLLGSKSPVVSVRSASTAKSDCSAELKFLDSFDRIYLCFDNDEAGQRAKAEVATLFDFNKLYDAKLDLKDANEYLLAGRESEFRNIWNNARRFLPEGIISSYNEIDSILDESSANSIGTFPFPTLQSMLDGIREEGLYLITAQEGIGKTEVIRSIEYHLLKSTDYNLGILHLEEPKKRTVQGFATYEIGVPTHLSDTGVSNDQIKNAYRIVTGRDERVHIYSHFGSDDPNVILDTIRFLISVCSCKFIFLDHISMVVSGLMDDDERKALDYISTQLAMMAVNLKAAIFIVSHINDDGKTRGSRNIAKVAHVRIDLKRNLEEENPYERNITTLMVTKNRPTGLTGPAGRLHFDPSTYKLEELRPVDELLPPRKSNGTDRKTDNLRSLRQPN